VSEYDGYDIKQLWQMVDAARQGLQPSHDQVAALNNAQQMLSGHAQSLDDARDQLAAKWPPETNAASAAYLTELDRLIAAVKDAALSCAVNVFHINMVGDAIIQAHDKLAPLHTEFVKNESALAQYDADIKSFGDGATLIPGGSAIASGAARLFTSPPVDDGRQDELTKQARQAMVPLAGAAQDGATYIKPPAPYEPPTITGDYIENPKQIGDPGSSGGATVPPRIDLPASTRGPAATPTSPTGDDLANRPLPGDSGPVLSGYSPLPVQPTTSPPLPGAPGPGSGTTIGALPSIISGLGGSPTGFGAPARGAGGRLPSNFAPGEAGPFGRGSAPRSGVIGTLPGGAGPVRSSPARVNPPGGVIGQQPGAGGKAAGRAASGRISGSNGAGLTGSRPGRRGPGTHGADRQHWDPDNPWEVDEGVDPVIVPDPSPARVDPGPGIIGLDR
jgi:hypothetical protein